MKKAVCTLFGLIFFTLSVVVYAADAADTQSLTPLNGANSFKDIEEGIASWDGGFSHYYYLNHFDNATSINEALVTASFSIKNDVDADKDFLFLLKEKDTITKSYSVAIDITQDDGKDDGIILNYRFGMDILYTYSSTEPFYTKSYHEVTHFYEPDQNDKPKKDLFLKDEPITDTVFFKEHVFQLDIAKSKSEASSYTFIFKNDTRIVGEATVANVKQINNVRIDQSVWWTGFVDGKPKFGFPVITKAIKYSICNNDGCEPKLDDNECNQVELDSAKQEGKQACIDDPLSCGIGKYLIFSNNANPVIQSGSSVNVYGNTEINRVTLKSGASAKLINFVGNNEVTVQADSTLFNVSRSGATVTFKDSTNNTVLTIPATKTPQSIIFNDRTLTLVVENNEVKLGNQVVNLTSNPIL